MPSLLTSLAAIAVAFTSSSVDGAATKPKTTTKKVTTARTEVPSGCPAGTRKLLSADFDGHSRGGYSSSELNSDFPGTFAINNKYELVELVADGNGGNALRHRHRSGCAGGNCGMWFQTKLPEQVDTVYYSFRLKFVGDGFDFRKGGKLPGVCGGTCNAGHRKPNGHDGWSVREMWGGRGDRAWLENYVYHAGQPGAKGEGFFWSKEVRPDNWYNLRVKVDMNSPGRSDGTVEAWLDGDKVLSADGMKFRSTGSLKIEYFQFSNFYGGEDSSWAPHGDQYMDFDDFLVCG